MTPLEAVREPVTVNAELADTVAVLREPLVRVPVVRDPADIDTAESELEVMAPTVPLTAVSVVAVNGPVEMAAADRLVAVSEPAVSPFVDMDPDCTIPVADTDREVSDPASDAVIAMRPWLKLRAVPEMEPPDEIEPAVNNPPIAPVCAETAPVLVKLAVVMLAAVTTPAVREPDRAAPLPVKVVTTDSEFAVRVVAVNAAALKEVAVTGPVVIEPAVTVPAVTDAPASHDALTPVVLNVAVDRELAVIGPADNEVAVMAVAETAPLVKLPTMALPLAVSDAAVMGPPTDRLAARMPAVIFKELATSPPRTVVVFPL